MYFWNIKELRSKLIDNSLSDKSQMVYLMLTMVLYALSGQIGGSDYVGGLFYIETIAVLVCTVLGILYCYRGNLAGDGKDFIKRYISVSWLVTLRVITVAAIILFIVGALIFLLDDQLDDSILDKFLGITSLVILEVIYFWLIHKHIKFISINSQKQ